ncbi:hypothetical protein NYP20_15755 [Pseudomonas sp. N3-W]|uniref:dermonecrotic toxin domain-containing protein n=1 Tax=Pseudomonas sp. N3-W TaxID=2975049 RepID=UPI00217E0A44|nr:DUF6543 domain-containing protein [Pseudomonas sp. N3-W]UWF46806.1 hypothetical protein NYP20_15755 [Pseudomonas sp. N3-W]
MTDLPLPYFFDEAEAASSRKQPGEREKALNFTLDDLKWLKAVYLATHAARAAHTPGMRVDRLGLTPAGQSAIHLAGAFAMSKPDAGEVVLYTPWKGLTKFADMADLKASLKQWLGTPAGRRELLCHLSIEQRGAVPAAAQTSVSTQQIDGAVFQDQEFVLQDNQRQNAALMLDELLKAPTLNSLLDDTLNNALGRRYPTLDRQRTRLESYITLASSDAVGNRRSVSSLSLHEAVLYYYLTNHWPQGDVREFSHPVQGASSQTHTLAWESAIKEIAQSLTPHLQSLLETFWNGTMKHGQSRSEFFAQCLCDRYSLELLLKRQQNILSAEEFATLRNVTLAGTDNAPVSGNPRRIDRVCITELYRTGLALAGTLMIDTHENSAFIYSPTRGIEANHDLAAIKATVSAMMTAEGHEDNLLNALAHEERDRFLAIPAQEQVVVAEPIVGSVFQQLMADILAKQGQNLRYGLRRYRESEGSLDAYALIDNILDVRALIDPGLLTVNVQGRWSTRMDQRWRAQPATVRGESAKQQLAILTSIDQALASEKYPVLSATVTTVAQAQEDIRDSLALLRPKLTHTLTTALQAELKLRTLARTLQGTEQAIVNAVLDTPVRLQRAALNGFLPDVFSLALKAGNTGKTMPLASCFVLTERGGLDPAHSGKSILWTPALGFEAFASIQPLLAELDRRLLSDDERSALIENLPRSQRLAGQSLALAPLQLIHEDFFKHLQEPHVRLDTVAVERMLDSRLPTTLRADLSSLVTVGKPKAGLQRAMDIGEALITREKLPTWLALASIDDQRLHAELLQQYLNNAKEDKDYLSGVRTLSRTAHHLLQQQLNTDGIEVDPDNVQVRINQRPTAAALTQTLTEFALTHLHELDGLAFTLASLAATALPIQLDMTYVKGLIRNLKLGERQRTTLSLAFAESLADAQLRRKRFAAQVPWQLLCHAHSEKLQERLSETGFDFIQQVMNMPDALAREAVTGANAIVRPLEFKGLTGESTIKAPGIYLIGPKPGTEGPQVLLAPYSATHGFKEYDSESHLLNELKGHGALQKWVLGSMSTADQQRCKTRIAATASNSISLASTPLRGNLLKTLFNDNVHLLTRLLGAQPDENRQSEWHTVKHVLGEDLDQASSLLTGKLAYPVTVGRSYREIKASAEDLQGHKWGSALKAFISGMAQLVMLRQSTDSSEVSPASTVESAAPTPPTHTQWKHIDITAPERTNLQRLESTGVDLNSLALQRTLGLYKHPTTEQHYAPVEGKVYPVEKRGSRWQIRIPGDNGPQVLQNAAKQWVPTADAQAQRFNLVGKLRTWIAISGGMNVEADGMPEIRRLFPVRARLIDEGLDLATHYAWNCFRNLELLKAPNSQITPAHQLIMDFLDVPNVLPEHVSLIEKTVSDIFAALLDPSLRQEKSKRFVVGRLMEDAENSFAFAIRSDRQQKIYLAEKFFKPGFEHYRNYMTDASFPISPHARAATLIHELSHIVNKTEDISYLDATRPFVDLIETTSGRARVLNNTLHNLQTTALSHKTPLNQLFAVYNDDTQRWEDLGDTTYEDTDTAYRHVLKMTGEATLSDARRRFRQDPQKRLAVMLGNADTVTWLITHLGRQLHTAVP